MRIALNCSFVILPVRPCGKTKTGLMIPSTAGSRTSRDDSTGIRISFNGNSTGNSTARGDASLSVVRTRSQERTQYPVDTRNPHSQTKIKIAEIGLAFGATGDGIEKGA